MDGKPKTSQVKLVTSTMGGTYESKFVAYTPT